MYVSSKCFPYHVLMDILGHLVNDLADSSLLMYVSSKYPPCHVLISISGSSLAGSLKHYCFLMSAPPKHPFPVMY